MNFQRSSTMLLVFFLMALQAISSESVFSKVERIVAVGDIHGDFGQFVKALRLANLLDEKNNWQGGKTHLVQVGDVLDRGPTSRKALDLLMNLQKQAELVGGKVHCLIGNHEALVMYGQYGYVHPGEFAAFGGRENFRKAFSPAGKYGQWIASNPAVIKINDILFVHAGISPKYASQSIDELNVLIQTEMKNPVLKFGIASLDPKGPLWYRGFALNKATKASCLSILKAYSANKMVVGHTVTKKGIQQRYDGHFIMIDVGLSKVYQGKPACLLVAKGKISVVTATGKKELK